MHTQQHWMCVCVCVDHQHNNHASPTTIQWHYQHQTYNNINVVGLWHDSVAFFIDRFFHCCFFCAKGAFFDFFFWAKLLYNSKYMYVQKSICQKLFFLGKWFSQLLLVIEVGFFMFIPLKKNKARILINLFELDSDREGGREYWAVY